MAAAVQFAQSSTAYCVLVKCIAYIINTHILEIRYSTFFPFSWFFSLDFETGFLKDSWNVENVSKLAVILMG